MRILFCIVFSFSFGAIFGFMIHFLSIDEFMKGAIYGAMTMAGSFIGAAIYDKFISKKQKQEQP